MSARDDWYRNAAEDHGLALERLAKAYEADPEERRDLLQEIHIAIWSSFLRFDGRCSVRTWVYRIAHNVAVTHIYRSKKTKSFNFLSIEELEQSESEAALNPRATDLESQMLLSQLYEFIQRLTPSDRQIITLYLEGLDAASIGEITGISATYAATKIHRIKRVLSERFRNGG